MGNSSGGGVHEMSVGDRLHMARWWKRKTQEEWAELTGISRGTIAAYERGDRKRLARPYLAEWARVAGVSVVWLETGVVPAPEAFVERRKASH
jgi:transcriptional regulator with XRE-family HTH domain